MRLVLLPTRTVPQRPRIEGTRTPTGERRPSGCFATEPQPESVTRSARAKEMRVCISSGVGEPIAPEFSCGAQLNRRNSL